MSKANGHIFISYAREDRGRVAVLVQLFENEGWAVWWDRDHLPAGRKFDQIIDQAIQDASCVLVCWSGAAIDSDWVLDEANEAKDQDKLIPVYLEAVKLPYGHRGYHCLDLSEWNNQATHEAYRRLKSELSQKQPLAKSVKPADSDDMVEEIQPYSPETQALIDKLGDPSLEPIERLKAGDKLAETGDPRPGVALDADALPDIDWIEISGGEFLYGEEKEPASIDSFYMARYLVTNEQYDAFITGGGYDNERWWQGLSERIKKPEKPRWTESNRPRETVSWYEAIAFCRWLSDRLGFEVSLASEQQWERAARGSNGREYPWGDGYQSGYANINEIEKRAGPNYLKQTSPVGMYDFAGSPEGIQDLSGNVWEWVLNEYHNPDNTSLKGEVPRVLRGGSWDYNPDYARASLRVRFNPDYRLDSVGFRVVCSSPIVR